MQEKVGTPGAPLDGEGLPLYEIDPETGLAKLDELLGVPERVELYAQGRIVPSGHGPLWSRSKRGEGA